MLEQEKNVYQGLIEGLTSSDRELKLISILAAGTLKIKAYTAHLTGLLSSPDPEIVEHTIRALGKIADPDSVKYIADFIINDQSHISEIAYEVLCNYDLKPALNSIIQSYTMDLPVKIRIELLNLVNDINDRRVSDLMSEVLSQTREPGCLIAALRYFIRFPLAERHTTLKLLVGDKDTEISFFALLALTRLKDENAFQQIKRLLKTGNYEIRQKILHSINSYPMIEDRDFYLLFFNDDRNSIREASLKGLSLFTYEERANLIKDWITHETDKNVYKKLLETAAAEKNPVFYELFYRMLQSPDDSLRDTAVNSLAQMGESIIDRLVIDFDRMPLAAKEQILLTLGKLKNKKAHSLIIDCLRAKERWLRINAVEAAGHMNDSDLDAELTAILTSKETDAWVIAKVIAVAGTSEKPLFIEAILPYANNPDARVRANAVEALTRLKYEGLADLSLELLTDKNDRVRVNAAIALWKLGHTNVFEELKQMATNKSRWIRSSAVFALSKIKCKESLQIILEMLDDPEELVYRNLVLALAESGDKNALLPLIKEARNKRLGKDFYERAFETFANAI